MRPHVLLAIAALTAGCAFPSPQAPTPYYEEVLRGAPFTDLVVEIDHAPGRQPSLAAREHLLEQLRAVTAKARVSIELNASLPDDPSKRWSPAELIELERTTRTNTHAAPTAVLHVLYPAGRYQNESAAGVTISGPVIGPVTVFLDTLDEIQSPVGAVPLPRSARDEVERATLLHEAGHAMGLVNNGLAMVRDHEDDENPGHSTNPDSVMYWQVESINGIRQALLRDGSVPSEFDADDRADMRGAGGR